MLKQTLSAIALSIVLVSLGSPAFAVPNERVESDVEVLATEFKTGDIITAKKMTRVVNILKLLHERVGKLEDRVKTLEKEKLLKDWGDDGSIYLHSPTSAQPRIKFYDCVQDKEYGWVLKEREVK